MKVIVYEKHGTDEWGYLQGPDVNESQIPKGFEVKRFKDEAQQHEFFTGKGLN